MQIQTLIKPINNNILCLSTGINKVYCYCYFCLFGCVKCFNIDVCIYSTCASSSFFHFSLLLFFILAFCHVDIDVRIYSTCTFFIVKWILMLTIYSTVSLYIFMGYSAV